MTGARSRSGAMWLGLAIAIACVSANAHDSWIEPSSFTPASGARIELRLCEGDGFEGWSLPRNNRRIEKFVASGPLGEQPIVGRDGSEPAGIARFATAGGYVIAYRSNRALTEVPAVEFDEYLREKGLAKILASRRQQGAGGKKVREAFSRHTKTLIRVGDAAGGVIDRPMGLRLEFVAEPNLLRADVHDARSFQLLHEGKPLAGVLVTATRPGMADDDLIVRTDAGGRASLNLRALGMWRVAAVHMIEAPNNVAAEWESLWTSLTFELPSGSSASARASETGRRTCQNRMIASAMQARP